MPRGNRSTTESNDNTDDLILAAGDSKIKTANTKVTLVKPLEENDTEVAEAPKPLPRPKVGRAGVARKNKPETPELASQVTSSASENTLTAMDAPLAVPETSLDGEDISTPQILFEPMTDWEATHKSRPWDIKFTLFLLALFALVNLGLVYLLNDNHKTRAAARRTEPAAESYLTPKEAALLHESTQPASVATPVAATPAVSMPADMAPVLPTLPPALPAADTVINTPPSAPAAETPAAAALPAMTAAPAESVAPSVAPAVPEAASTETSAPAQPATPAIADTTPITMPAGPVAADTGAADTAAAAAKDKADSQNELLSIITKN